MIILDERTDLWADRGAIEAHHKELAHLPAIWEVSIRGSQTVIVMPAQRPPPSPFTAALLLSPRK